MFDDDVQAKWDWFNDIRGILREALGTPEGQGILQASDKESISLSISLLNNLQFSVPFYWTREIIELVKDAGRTVDLGVRWHQEWAPTLYGFWYFQEPLLDLRNGSNRVTIHGLSWMPLVKTTSEYQTEFSPTISFTPPPMDQVTGIVFSGWASEYIEDAVKHTQPVPLWLCIWGMGTTLATAISNLEGMSYIGPFSVNDIAPPLARFFLAGLLFLQQKLLITSHHTPSRGLRRRIPRDEPDVRIVRLRSVRHSSPHNDSEIVEWSCRWIVSGHWRAQWYPSLQRHQQKWITPYIKGPDNKPLKSLKEKVYAVVR